MSQLLPHESYESYESLEALHQNISDSSNTLLIVSNIDRANDMHVGLRLCNEGSRSVYLEWRMRRLVDVLWITSDFDSDVFSAELVGFFRQTTTRAGCEWQRKHMPIELRDDNHVSVLGYSRPYRALKSMRISHRNGGVK